MNKSNDRKKPASTKRAASGKSRPRKSPATKRRHNEVASGQWPVASETNLSSPAVGQESPPCDEVASGQWSVVSNQQSAVSVQPSVISNLLPALQPPLPVDEHPHFDKPRVVRYLDARGCINDCDLLLRRAEACPSSQAIAAGGRSIYSHAAMAGWWNDNLMCLEVVEHHGGRARHLSGYIEENPGSWDVFETNPDCRWPFFNAYDALDAMIKLTRVRYGWRNLFRASLSHMPIVRLFVAPPLFDERDDGSAFCSQAVSRALRAGGVDPVPFLADCATEPGDLARSSFFRYRFTLVP